MIHIYQKGTSQTTFCLFHSEGKDEHELLYVAKQIDPNANVLAIRGPINEYGNYRFFKRKKIGVYDEVSLHAQTHNLRTFILESARAFKFDASKVIVIGNGHGANIAINMLFHYEKAFFKAILFHPKIPRRPKHLPNLEQLNVFIGAGEKDFLTPKHEVLELVQILHSANADVELYFTKYGHQISKDEVEAAKNWYQLN